MKVKLSDVCSSIYDGDHSAPPKSESGIPFVTISNFDASDGRIDFADTAFVPVEYYESLKPERRPAKNDVLYSVVGSFGIPSLVKDESEFVFQRHIAILRPNELIDPRYLYYVMKNRDFYHWADSVAIGAAQRTVTLGQLRSKEIELPELDAQKRIADMLSAYDELIENNRRQIKLLEEAAQRLYKEWFVDLKFPGHETTPIHNGIPEGWERVSLRNFIASHIGGGWGKELSESSYPVQAAVIRATDIEAIRNGSVKYIPVRWHSESNFQKRKLGVGDIVFEVSGGSKEAGVGRSLLITEEVLSMFDGPAICASFCKRIHLAEFADSALLYWKIRSDLKAGLIRKYEKSSAGNIINFHWEDFLDGYELFIPCSPVKEKFVSAVGAYAKALGICIKQISAAREARDRLLPKLMSGEIEV